MREELMPRTRVAIMLDRLRPTRLVDACSRLNPDEEQAMADEGLARDLAEWPEY